MTGERLPCPPVGANPSLIAAHCNEIPLTAPQHLEVGYSLRELCSLGTRIPKGGARCGTARRKTTTSAPGPCLARPLHLNLPKKESLCPHYPAVAVNPIMNPDERRP